MFPPPEWCVSGVCGVLIVGGLSSESVLSIAHGARGCSLVTCFVTGFVFCCDTGFVAGFGTFRLVTCCDTGFGTAVVAFGLRVEARSDVVQGSR